MPISKKDRLEIGHRKVCLTAESGGPSTIKNGELLRLADGQFEALLTVDQGIEYQQNLSTVRRYWKLAAPGNLVAAAS